MLVIGPRSTLQTWSGFIFVGLEEVKVGRLREMEILFG